MRLSQDHHDKEKCMKTVIAVIAAVGLLMGSPSAQAGPLAPQKASRVATLLSFLSPGGAINSAACPENGFANATSRAFDFQVAGATFVPFALPQNQVFVATRFDWTITGAPPATLVAVRLTLQTIGFNSFSAQSSALADAEGNAGGAEVLGSGIVLRPEEQLCLSLRTPVSSVQGSVQGFFAADK
jgi:hypothetical protein